MKKQGTTESTKKRQLKKILTNLLTAEDDDDEEKESDNDDDEYSQELTSVDVGAAVCALGGNVEDRDGDHIAMLARQNEPTAQRYIIDSGCRGAHIVTNPDILQSTLDTSNWRRMPSITGVTGHKLHATGAGSLARVAGTALVTPEADSNLLSLMEMVKSNNGSFIGDKDHIIIRDGQDRTILKGFNRGDDFWTCEDHDLRERVKAFTSEITNTLVPDHVAEVFNQPPDSHLQQLRDDGQIYLDPAIVQSTRPHLSAEERARAKEAYELCRLLRHPGD